MDSRKITGQFSPLTQFLILMEDEIKKLKKLDVWPSASGNGY